MTIPSCAGAVLGLARLLTLAVVACTAPLAAAVGLLVGEPFGKFGFFNPTGHAAVYLSRVCAESPTVLRRCQPGENGVVISRYRDIGGYDWIAVPPLPFLFAVEDPNQLDSAAALPSLFRDRYRLAHLQEIAPDREDGAPPKGDWPQLVGAAYDRTIYAFLLETSPEDDDRLIDYLNARPNRRRFNLFFRNCANFAAEVVNFYYPGAIRRSFVADFGILTPKHAAKSLVAYGRKNPETQPAQRVVPQVTGARRSARFRGVSESLVRSKKYLAPLAVFQPWVAAGAAAAYISTGRFDPSRLPVEVCPPDELAGCLAPGGR